MRKLEKNQKMVNKTKGSFGITKLFTSPIEARKAYLKTTKARHLGKQWQT